MNHFFQKQFQQLNFLLCDSFLPRWQMDLQNTAKIDRSKAKLLTLNASLFKNRAVVDDMRSSMLC